VGKTEHIRYCGSPIALSFDEAKHDKRVLLVDFSQAKLSTVTDVKVPCFQPLAMIKTSLAALSHDIEELVSEVYDEQDKTKIWLDIELSDASLLTELQPKITSLVKDFPVEVLLVRREKQVRQRLMLQNKQNQSTLNELRLEDVFDSRLQQEPWLSSSDEQKDEESKASEEKQTNEQVLARKVKLQTLFKQTVEQVLKAGES